jgi:hypothetical protein
MSGWSLELAVEAKCSSDNIIWLRSHGCPYNERSLGLAFKRDDSLVIVPFVLEEKFTRNFSSPLWGIVYSGDVSHLKLLHDNNVLFDESHFHLAIEQKRPIEILQSLIRYVSNSWDTNTFKLAIIEGDLRLLQWLKEEGCPWDASLHIHAINARDRRIVEWLHKEKCPLNEATKDVLLKTYVFTSSDY